MLGKKGAQNRFRIPPLYPPGFIGVNLFKKSIKFHKKGQNSIKRAKIQEKGPKFKKKGYNSIKSQIP